MGRLQARTWPRGLGLSGRWAAESPANPPYWALPSLGQEEARLGVSGLNSPLLPTPAWPLEGHFFSGPQFPHWSPLPQLLLLHTPQDGPLPTPKSALVKNVSFWGVLSPGQRPPSSSTFPACPWSLSSHCPHTHGKVGPRAVWGCHRRPWPGRGCCGEGLNNTKNQRKCHSKPVSLPVK